MERMSSVFWLGLKEMRSLLADPVLLGFLIYAFSFAVYLQATGVRHELRNAAIAVVDEDRSALSLRIIQAFHGPEFRAPDVIPLAEVDRRMDVGRSSFILDIPPQFQAHLLAGRRPAIQVNIDATAVMHAGIGAGFIQQIISDEIRTYLGTEASTPVTLQLRVAFNPNLETSWFTGTMALVNNITMLAVLLAGGAVIREREHGTLDHLLVMPLSPLEIALAKIWSNIAIITAATWLSLWLVLRGMLGVPIAGSITLFLAGVAVYLFYATAVGLLLGTIARSMPQLGLLFILIVQPMILLSGGNTPFESMPRPLQIVMMMFPSTHFVAFAQAVLYRGGNLIIVWPAFAATALIGSAVLAVALLRFRATLAASRS